MTDTTHLEAKVLLLEHDPQQCKVLTDFCDSVGLVPLLRTSHDALNCLEQHKDLAGVLLAEDLPCGTRDALHLAESIHRLRPELPIFLRRTAGGDLDALYREFIRYPWPTGDICLLYTSPSPRD